VYIYVRACKYIQMYIYTYRYVHVYMKLMYGYVHTYGYPVTEPPRTAFPRREEDGWGGSGPQGPGEKVKGVAGQWSYVGVILVVCALVYFFPFVACRNPHQDTET